MKGFSDIARPLYNLEKKSVKFHWTEQCEEAFGALKRCLMTSSILAYPDHSDEFFLDASAFGIGAVLSQVKGGSGHVIAYVSKAVKIFKKPFALISFK